MPGFSRLNILLHYDLSKRMGAIPKGEYVMLIKCIVLCLLSENRLLYFSYAPYDVHKNDVVYIVSCGGVILLILW